MSQPLIFISISLLPQGFYSLYSQSLLACTLFKKLLFIIRLAIVLDSVSILLLDQIQRPKRIDIIVGSNSEAKHVPVYASELL